MWSPLAERYIATGVKRGRAEGRAEGKVEGRVEGKVEGELEGRIEAIISILDVKFGEISETIRDSLRVITDVNQLQGLVRFATKCDTFEEFYKKLKSAKRNRD